MDIVDRTARFAEILSIDSATAQDLYAKYALLADAYGGSAGTQIIEDNKDTFEKLLSPTMIDYMLFMNQSGSLANELAKYPNLRQVVDNQSPMCLTKIAKRLNESGWTIKRDVTLDEIKTALFNFGIPTTEDISNAELLNYIDETNENSEIPDIAFDDDIELNEEIGGEEAYAIQPENTEDIFKGHVEENFDVARQNRSGESEDEDEDFLDIPVEKEIKYEPKVVKAEIEEAEVTSIVGNTLNDPGTSDDTPDWAKDTNGDAEGLKDLPSEVDSVITSIVQRIEGVMRSCFELDRPYGIITENGIVKYHTDPQKKTLVIDSPKSQGGRSEMEILYNIILQSAGVKLKSAPDSRFVANYTNITGKGSRGGTEKFDYYPGQMLKYALGFISGKKHSTWKVFEQELRKSLKNRLNEFYKKEGKDGISEYYLYREKFVQIYSNSLLVIAYSSSGLTIRASLIGMSENIESNIKSRLSKISIFANSKVTVYPVSGYRDVVDIQIINDIDTVMGKPSWAYKALKVKLDNGEAPSLSGGLPIGKKVNGEIIEFKLDPSSRFMIFVAAGSGSGKGVLTLSLVAAALGSGIPLFYTDYKPDMAPIFWEMSGKLGKQVYSFDSNVKAHKNDVSTGYLLGESIPDKLKPHLSEFAGALLYLRSIALMCAIADYRNTHGFNDDGIMFVFDEIQAMQRLIYSMVDKVQNLYNDNKPPQDAKKAYEGDEEIYNYCAKLLNWLSSVDTGLDKYTITTGRQGAVFSMFIGQNATAELWNNLIPKIKMGKSSGQDKPFMARLLKCGTVTKLMGKGTTSSQYGLGGAKLSSEENLYITKYRYFALYDGPNASIADVQAFKPFLTLNYDDIFAKCWTNGVGKTYGYKNPGKGVDRNTMVSMNQEYIQNMQEAFPGEPGYSNEYNVHPGVGLLGLASMYCNGNIERLSESFGKSYQYAMDFFNLTNLNRKYGTVEDYIYDMSPSAWLSQEAMQAYTPGEEEELNITDDDTEGFEDHTDLYMGGNEEAQSTGEQKTTVNEGIQQPFAAQQVAEEKLPKEVLEMRRRRAEIEKQEKVPFTPQNNIRPPEVEKPPIDFNIPNMEDEAEDFQYHGDTEPLSGEAGFNRSGYSEQQRIDDYYTDAQPAYMPPYEDKTFQFGGKTGRVTYITPDETTRVLGLTKENSVVVAMSEYDSNEKFSKRLFSSLGGAQYEFKCRWKTILDGITTKKNVGLITRATILEDAIVFNKKMVATINILGGEEDVRIEDIVNFTMTAKKFPNIREIIVDTTIFERAQAELGDPINGIFNVFKQLSKLCVIETGCGEPKILVTRQDLMQGQIDARAQEAAEKAQFKNQMEAVAAAKNPNLREKSPGYQSKVWEASKRFQGQGWGAARDALMEKNPKLFKAAGLGLVSIGVLGVGAVIGAFGKIGSLFRR